MRPLFVFHHLQKTAGTSFQNTVELNLGKDGIALYPYLLRDERGPGALLDAVNEVVLRDSTPTTLCIYGHLAYYGIHRLLGAEVAPRYITFLRDPVERVVSLYYFLKGAGTPHLKPLRDEIVDGGWSLEEWFLRTRLAGGVRNGQTKFLLFGYAAVWGYFISPSNRVRPIHFEVDEQHLAQARRLLDEFWFVGLTEAFSRDSEYLYGKMGFDRRPENPVANASPDKQPVEDRVRRLIADGNSVDYALYEHAKAKRARFIAEHGGERTGTEKE